MISAQAYMAGDSKWRDFFSRAIPNEMPPLFLSALFLTACIGTIGNWLFSSLNIKGALSGPFTTELIAPLSGLNSAFGVDLGLTIALTILLLSAYTIHHSNKYGPNPLEVSQ